MAHDYSVMAGRGVVFTSQGIDVRGTTELMHFTEGLKTLKEKGVDLVSYIQRIRTVYKDNIRPAWGKNSSPFPLLTSTIAGVGKSTGFREWYEENLDKIVELLLEERGGEHLRVFFEYLEEKPSFKEGMEGYLNRNGKKEQSLKDELRLKFEYLMLSDEDRTPRFVYGMFLEEKRQEAIAWLRENGAEFEEVQGEYLKGKTGESGVTRFDVRRAGERKEYQTDYPPAELEGHVGTAKFKRDTDDALSINEGYYDGMYYGEDESRFAHLVKQINEKYDGKNRIEIFICGDGPSAEDVLFYLYLEGKVDPSLFQKFKISVVSRTQNSPESFIDLYKKFGAQDAECVAAYRRNNNTVSEVKFNNGKIDIYTTRGQAEADIYLQCGAKEGIEVEQITSDIPYSAVIIDKHSKKRIFEWTLELLKLELVKLAALTGNHPSAEAYLKSKLVTLLSQVGANGAKLVTQSLFGKAEEATCKYTPQGEETTLAINYLKTHEKELLALAEKDSQATKSQTMKSEIEAIELDAGSDALKLRELMASQDFSKISAFLGREFVSINGDLMHLMRLGAGDIQISFDYLNSLPDGDKKLKTMEFLAVALIQQAVLSKENATTMLTPEVKSFIEQVRVVLHEESKTNRDYATPQAFTRYLMNAKGLKGQTLLEWAITTGKVDLIADAVESNTVSINGSLFMNGSQLVGGSLLKLADNGKNTFLHQLAKAGKADVIKGLFDQYKGEVNLHAKNNDGLTPLQILSKNTQQEAVASLLNSEKECILSTLENCIELLSSARGAIIGEKTIEEVFNTTKIRVAKLHYADVDRRNEDITTEEVLEAVTSKLQHYVFKDATITSTNTQEVLAPVATAIAQHMRDARSSAQI